MASPPRVRLRPSLQEFGLIRTLKRRFERTDSSIKHGIGDDAAVLAAFPHTWTLLTTDLLTEGVHFERRTASFVDIGFRAAAANLSDIAAMGGTPRYVLVALAIPAKGTESQVRRLYQGIMTACRPHGVRLIGGDTSTSTGGWFVSMTLIGSVQPRQALLRSGARTGDSLYVTGTLGDSLAGLTLLKESQHRLRHRSSTKSLSSRHRQFLIQRHLRPTPRIAVGRWLSTEGLATAAIDISDGLSGDIRHICEESGVGARIDSVALPLSPACRAYAEAHQTDPRAIAMAGGEDYELLFTVSPRRRRDLERAVGKLRLPVSRIGMIQPAKLGVQFVSGDGRVRSLPVTSYEHFRSKA